MTRHNVLIVVCVGLAVVAAGLPAVVRAHVPVLVHPSTPNTVMPIEDPRTSTAYYGTLDGYPHTFEIRAEDPFSLRVETLVPDIPEVSLSITGIIIRETGFRGRVSEVARLVSRDATWESFYEPWGGDRYRRGVRYETSAEAGVYRIEVSTPDNVGQYVLVVGTEETFSGIGYFTLLARMIEVKQFFGKSPVRIIESPLVYVPLMLFVVVCAFVVWYRRSNTRTTPDTVPSAE